MRVFSPKFSLAAKRNFAAAMRAKPTNGEAAMWEILRADAFGVRFRRQIAIAGWIVDFFCPTLRLAIEVDGSAHDSNEAKESDRIKELTLVSKGIRVVRFTNDDVLNFSRVVCLRVEDECKALGLDRAVSRQSLKGVVFASRIAGRKPIHIPVVAVVACVSVEKCTSNDAYRKPATAAPVSDSQSSSCKTRSDLVGDRRITAQEVEQLQRKLERLSRQRSMTLGISRDSRSAEEKAADLRYRFNEMQSRKARQA